MIALLIIEHWHDLLWYNTLLHLCRLYYFGEKKRELNHLFLLLLFNRLFAIPRRSSDFHPRAAAAATATAAVHLGCTTLLTSQVISVAFYSEREKSDKFCWEALISAWGSFSCRKSTTRDPRLYFPSKLSNTQDFYALKKIHRPRPGYFSGTMYSRGLEFYRLFIQSYHK